MPKSDLRYRDGEYAPVADRIALFWSRFPDGRIITDLVSRSATELTVRAMIYRYSLDDEPAATGWAAERPGDGDINTVACLENTETSAIGRALANLGFTASPHRPSAEEMDKATRERARMIREQVRRAVERSAPRTESASEMPTDELQRAANAVHDALSCVEQAEALGFAPARATRLRAWLLAGTVRPEVVERIERAVRGWIARRRPLRHR